MNVAEPGSYQLSIFRRDFSWSLRASSPQSVVFEVQHHFSGLHFMKF